MLFSQLQVRAKLGEYDKNKLMVTYKYQWKILYMGHMDHRTTFDDKCIFVYILIHNMVPKVDKLNLVSSKLLNELFEYNYSDHNHNHEVYAEERLSRILLRWQLWKI